MPYTLYNAYVVQSNFFVILGLVVTNHLATIFDFKLLLLLLNWFWFQIAEITLIGICCYNMYSVSSDLFEPYFANIQIPYGEYLFAPGPIVTIVFRLFHLILSSILPNRVRSAAPATLTTSATTAVPQKQDSVTNVNSVFNSFLSSNNATTPQPTSAIFNSTTTGISTAPQPTSSIFNSTTTGISAAPQPTSSLVNATNSSNNSSLSSFFGSINNDNETQQQQQFGVINNKYIIQPQLASSINLTAQSTSQSNFISGRPIPKLKYTPCIKPPLEPSAHRERLLWYLSPTPEVVEDFRIEQVLGFQKHWHSFSDRHSRTQYDNLTAALLKYIFTPLSNSIETIDKKLAPKQTIATCPPGMVALSYLMPEFNQDTVFTIGEVLKFLTLNGHSSTESIQYVGERVKELASNKKMAAYTYTPKITGMPTDSDIIMHVFNTYLNMKEPYAIPPLVPAEIDLFKFLLIFVYMTPE
ncbi:unnamed protein product [Mucor hiemalis]